MNRSLLLGILILSLILIGMATFTNGILAVSALLIVYLFAGLLFGPRQINLEVIREITPERISPDRPVEILLTITNNGSRLEEVLFQDMLPPQLEIIDGESCLLTSLNENEVVELKYLVQGKRGIYYFEGLEVNASDLFGIRRRSKLMPVQGSIFITPHVPKIKHVAIRPRQTRVYSGTIPASLGGPGVEFFGVREYQQGDTIHRINWKVSARHQETLYSNEFMQERVTDIGLILDARQVSDIKTTAGTLFEHQITATAALTDSLLSDGNRVGLLVYGQFLDWTYPGYGREQRERILHALTRAQTGDSLVFEKLENLPTKMFPNHSQLILFSPLLDDDLPILVSLRARGYQVMIISPDPIAFQKNSMPKSNATELGARLARIERRLLFDQLRHTGIVILNWDVSVPFDQAMQAALSRLSLWSRPIRGSI